jgi:chromosome segregation ATPase
MKRAALLLSLAFLLAACAKPVDPAPALRAEIADLRAEVERLDARLTAAEKQATAAEGRIARCEEQQRDLAGVMDKVTVRLDRVDR